jgi:hypothetical protein
MFTRLTPDGQRAARQRFIQQGLAKAGWRPETQRNQLDPAKFADFLDTTQSRRAMSVLFSPLDQEALTGAREYLKLTAKAGMAGKGVGMAAAGEKAGIGSLIAAIAIVPGALARTAESDFMRDQFIKLAHAKGNEKVTQAVMDELRPAAQAVAQQWQQKNSDLPLPKMDAEITPEMIKKQGSESMEKLRKAASQSGTTLVDLPHKVMGLFQ